jgi:MYXO-CTERM domain-containing protein
MAPTDASGFAQGLVNLYVKGNASGIRSEGLSGVSWAFIDPALSIDSDYLAAFPDAQLLLTPGVGNQMVPSPVPEADTWAMLLAGLGLVGVAARRRRG